MFNTIIIPIDLSHPDKANNMITVAKHFAGAEGKIVLTTVLEEVPPVAALELPPDFMVKSMRSAHDQLNEIAQGADLKADINVRRGQAASEILALAEEKHADVIVIASHRPGLQDYFLGSTAARVVRHAKCSVMIIR